MTFPRRLTSVGWTGWLLAATLLTALLPVAAHGQAEPAVRPAPDFDIREPLRHALPSLPAAAPPAQQKALAAAQASTKGLVTRWSELTGAPSRLYSLTDPLTGPSAGKPESIAANYLQTVLPLLHLAKDDVSELRLSRDYRTAHNGMAHLTLQQQIGGVDVFGASVNVNIDRVGRVQNLVGELMPGVHASANTKVATLTPDDAIRQAAAHAGVANIRGNRTLGQVYFPLRIGKSVLAWRVVVDDRDTPNSYDTIVDATDGTVLWRRNLTNYIDGTTAHGTVYSRSSPTPDLPIGTFSYGNPATNTVARVDLPFNGLAYFPFADPHADWWAGAGPSTTSSNNVVAYLDRDDTNAVGFQPTPGAGGVFNFALDLTQDPSVETATVQNESSAITNLFYWSNRVHDLYYTMGFDEAAGNFQSNNFGLGGSGGDPVLAEAQDGANPVGNPTQSCNANFNTPGDGSSGRMQMYVCPPSPTPAISPTRDGDIDGIVYCHELTHGLSNRLISNLGNTQGGGMGEGWSDFMALSILSEKGWDLLNGNYGVGQWLFNNPNGIRRQLYSTDQTVFTRTFANIADSTEVHNVGEIWCNTLWIARANLVWKYGFAVGNLTMMQTVMDGMKLDPSNPDFLDSRDAILKADQNDTGGANQSLLWDAFAHMGMGVYASTTGSTDGAPHQDFTTPSQYTPSTGVSGVANFGVVCVGSTQTNQFEISNTGTGDLVIKKVYIASGSGFSVNGLPTLPVIVSAGAHIDFNVTLSPSAQGAASADLRIVTNVIAQPTVDVTLTGSAPAGTLAVTPPSIDFGPVCPGDVSNQTITVNNTGQCPVTVSSITISGDTTDFSISAPTTSTVIAAGSAITIGATFKPTTYFSTPQTATVLVVSDASTSPQTVTLTGSAPPPVISVTPCPLDFGTVCADDAAGHTKTIQVCNKGTHCPLVVTGVSVSTADFTVVGPTSFSVAAGTCANVTIKFTPTSAGAKSATFTITSNDPNTPTVTCTVTGSTPLASVSAANHLAFPPTVIQSAGPCYSQLALPIQNTGQCSATITAIAITGANASEFTVVGLPAGGLPTRLTPGELLGDGNLVVQFRPTAIQRWRNAVLTVTYVSDPITGATATATVPLYGEGVTTGARVLVRLGGVPVASVAKLQLQRIVGNRAVSNEVTLNDALMTVTGPVPELSFQYHREWGGQSNPVQLLTGNYQVTASIVVNGKRMTQTVYFSLGTCDFNQNVYVDF